MKKALVVMLMVFTGALVFAGGRQSSGASNPPITHPTYGQLPYTEIDWYFYEDPQPDVQMVYDAAAEYVKSIINAKINFHSILGTEYRDRTSVMLASGGNEGIYSYWSLNYNVSGAQGLFYPMDEVLDKYGPAVKAGFNSQIWDAMRINGKIYGVPALKDNAYVFPLLYNDTMAKKLGIDVTTWPHTTQYYKLEPYFNEVMEKRNQVYGVLEEPLLQNVGSEVTYSHAVDSLFGNNNAVAVVNFPDFMDIKGYPPEQYFNLYATQEYRDFCKATFRMAKKNIINQDYNPDWLYTGNMFGVISWGSVWEPENLFGDNWLVKIHEADRYWTDAGNFMSVGNSFSANISNPERAMMFLDLLFSDPHLATMTRFGIEGVHHTITPAGKMVITPANSDPTARRYYTWYGISFGNMLIANAPEEVAGPDNITMRKIQEANDVAVASLYFGMVFNPAPIANELAACTNVIQEYQDTLNAGRANSEAEVDRLIDEFNAKLKANGLDRILAEVQKQADAFRASRR
jgi:putative aldouronate transport system substrate-binding protein